MARRSSARAADDFNGDGRPDVAIGDDSGVVRIFPNSCGQAAIDLSVTAADAPDPVAQGDLVTYTAIVRNLTLTPAANVTVIATLPTTSLVQSTSDSGGTQSVNGRQVTWTLPTRGERDRDVHVSRRDVGGRHGDVHRGGHRQRRRSDPSNNTAVETTTVQPMVKGTVCASPTLSGPTILPAGTTTGAADINVGDLNGDGRPDLVTSMANANAVAVYLGNASGGYSAATLYQAGTQPIDAVLVDLNGDGKLDLAIEGLSDAYILIGNGTGGFAAPTTITFAPEIVSDVRNGDFNGDGKADLAIATITNGQPTGGHLRILLNDGAGGFTAGGAIALNANSGRLAIGDFNGDGRADVAASFASTTAFADHVTVMLGNGSGGFVSTIDVPTGQSATDASVAALGDSERRRKARPRRGGELGNRAAAGPALRRWNGPFHAAVALEHCRHLPCRQCRHERRRQSRSRRDQDELPQRSPRRRRRTLRESDVLLGADCAGATGCRSQRRRPRGRRARDAARRGRRRRGDAERLRTRADGFWADRQRLARPGPGRRHADLLHDGHEQRTGRGQQRQRDRDAACLCDRNLGHAGGRNVRGSVRLV